MTNQLAIAFAISLSGLEVFYVWKFGLQHLFDDTKKLVDRIIYGPSKKVEPLIVESCEVIHKTARLEVEIYGKVLSQDVTQHLTICHKGYSQSERHRKAS